MSPLQNMTLKLFAQMFSVLSPVTTREVYSMLAEQLRRHFKVRPVSIVTTQKLVTDCLIFVSQTKCSQYPNLVKGISADSDIAQLIFPRVSSRSAYVCAHAYISIGCYLVMVESLVCVL